MSKAIRQTGGWKGPSEALKKKAESEDLLTDPAFQRLLGDAAKTRKFCRRCLEKKPDVASVSLAAHVAIEAGIPAPIASDHNYPLCASCRSLSDRDAWILRNLRFRADGAFKPFVSASGGGRRDDET